MVFSSLIGNERAKFLLNQFISQEKDSYVLLFSGPKEVPKETWALHFISLLLGQKHAHKVLNKIHPDVVFLRPEGKMHLHSIASIKQMIDEAPLSPFEAKKKVYLIEEADRMLPSSSNALLKLLEEPPPHACFILTTSYEEGILPTISSRCSRIYFHSSEESCSKEEDPIHLYFLEILKCFFLQRSSVEFLHALDSLDKMLEKQAGEDRAAAQLAERLLNDLFFWIRDLYAKKNNAPLTYPKYETDINRQSLETIPSLETALFLIEEARTALQRSIRPKLVFEYLFSKLIESNW